MIYLNITRVLSYLLVIALAIHRDVAWWVPVVFLLWDTPYGMVCKLPWVKWPPPGPARLPTEELDLQRLLQYRATQAKQNGEVIH